MADLSQQLTPNTVPLSVVACAYLTTNPADTAPVRLTRSAFLAGDLGGLASTLSLQPKQVRDPLCTLDVRPSDADTYLLGLTFPHGVEWVVVPGDHCAGATNGTFVSRSGGGLAASVASWVDAGRFVDPARQSGGAATSTSDTDGPPCPGLSSGRLGDDQQLVPDGVSGAQICRSTPESPRAAIIQLDSAEAGRLALAMDALPAQPDRGCTMTDEGTIGYSISFYYPHGRSAWVTVDAGCAPQVRGPYLSSADAQSVQPLLNSAMP